MDKVPLLVVAQKNVVGMSLGTKMRLARPTWTMSLARGTLLRFLVVEMNRGGRIQQELRAWTVELGMSGCSEERRCIWCRLWK